MPATNDAVEGEVTERDALGGPLYIEEPDLRKILDVSSIVSGDNLLTYK